MYRMTDPLSTEAVGARRNARPQTVTLAAALQLLFAAVFVIAPIVLIFYGAGGQAASRRREVSHTSTEIRTEMKLSHLFHVLCRGRRYASPRR